MFGFSVEPAPNHHARRALCRRSSLRRSPLLLIRIVLRSILFVAFPSYQSEGELLAELHALLIESVDIQQFAHEGGLELHELQKRAQVFETAFMGELLDIN